MTEVYFKNKNRNRRVVKEPFQPEHERLNMEPEVHDVSNSFPIVKDSQHATSDVSQIPEVGNGSEHLWVDGLNKDEGHEVESIAEDQTEFTVSQVPVGQYILLYKDNVLDAGAFNKVKETLTNVLMDSDEGASLSVDDFVVLKRLHVKAGVFIDE